MASAPSLFRAQWVVPITAAPLSDGGLLIANGRIMAVGSWEELRRRHSAAEINLGTSIVLPGLINAHCHLDYTDCAGKIAPPKSFSDWIKALLAWKAHQTYSDYAVSWLKGARMLLAHGTTTVADIEAVPELLPDVLTATPLRVLSLLELTGVRSRRPPAEILGQAIQTLSPLTIRGYSVGLSPHAPYSTSPELLRLSAEAARLRAWLMAVHVAESAEEFEMFTAARGAMFKWLAPQRDSSDCGMGSPIAHLHRHGVLGPNLMAVHANYLAPGDGELLARHEVSVVHCPRSHAYFQHAPFPLKTLADAGVNLCLGTDSLATVPRRGRAHLELDLFAEMRAMAAGHPELGPAALLEMVTVNAAKALGLAGRIGELSEGAEADLIVLPSSPRTVDPVAAILRYKGQDPAVMIQGAWIHAPGFVGPGRVTLPRAYEKSPKASPSRT